MLIRLCTRDQMGLAPVRIDSVTKETCSKQDNNDHCVFSTGVYPDAPEFHRFVDFSVLFKYIINE